MLLTDIAPVTVEGGFYFTENGVRRPMRTAFVRGCLLGIHLTLPRSLSAHGVCACLAHDTGDEESCVPLSLVGCTGDQEEYAALFDSGRKGELMGVFSLSLFLQTPRGRLYLHSCEDGRLRLLPEAASFTSVLFFEGGSTGGGACYFLPYEDLFRTGGLCRGDDGDYDRFFSHLAAHGVRTLFLLLPASGDAHLCDLGLSLPEGVRECAKEHGVSCLLDLLPFLCLHRAGRAAEPNDPVGYRLCDDTGDLPAIVSPLTPRELCGEDGILARAIAGGYGGVVLRYADRLGDPLLCAVRAELCARLGADAPFVVCQACTDISAFPAPRSRRFYRGTVSGAVSYTLKNALLDYLGTGETELLSACFMQTMAQTPAPILCHTVHPLDEVGGARFADLLAALPTGEENAPSVGALLRLAALISATVTGTPALPDEGEEEDAFAFRLRLFGICRKERALLSGALALHTLRPDLLVFSRAREGEMLTVVINRSPDTLVASSPDGFSVLLGGRGRKLVQRIAPYSGTVLRFSLFAGEHPSLSLRRQKQVVRDTRFAPRVATSEEKTS